MRVVLSALLTIACDGGGGGADAGGMDAALPPDSGPPDSGPVWTGPGCSETLGIECDGDWTGQCATPCAASECCSPQEGRFRCVPRGEGGSCPAANIWVDADRIRDSATGQEHTTVQWRFFPEGDCALVEGCVEAPGWRRLLRFGTWTPNTGEADLYLGRPADEPPFVYSGCHDHYHFNGYAEYELRNGDGSVAAEGHKQAFCLLDFYRYPGTDDTGWHYDCDNQGIQRGWQDVYDENLDCQWVDVTDVTPGEYTLHIALNVDRALLESSYDDNTADITVTIPEDLPVDVTQACASPREGVARDCGWTAGSSYTCTPGSTIDAGCSAACGRGSCTGDTVLRVCDTSALRAANDCAGRAVLDENDDSGCSRSDVCSNTSFTCPESGQFVVYWGGYESADASATCTIATNGTPVTP